MTCPCEVLETALVVSSERVSGLSRGQGPVSAITPEETSWERTFRETRFPGRGDSYEDPAELADAPTSVAGPALSSECLRPGKQYLSQNAPGEMDLQDSPTGPRRKIHGSRCSQTDESKVWRFW